MANLDSFSAPPSRAFAVTPHDSTNFTHPATGLYVGGTGNIAIVLEGETSAVTLTSVPVGTFLRMRIKRVNSTSTTATSMVAFY